MNSICKVLLIIVIFCSQATAQGYEVTYEFRDPGYVFTNTHQKAATIRLFSTSETKLLPSINGFGKGTIKISGKPLVVILNTYEEVEENGITRMLCGISDNSHPISLKDCDSFEGTLVGECGNAYVKFSIKPLPTIFSKAPAGDYCENSVPKLVANNMYADIQWQIKTATSNWTNISVGTTLQIDLKKLFESNYGNYLNQALYFRYGVGACDINTIYSPAAGPYVFQINKPTIINAQATSPLCNKGTDALLQITSLDRQLIAGETITYTMYTEANEFVAQLRSSNPVSESAPIIFNGREKKVAPFGIPAGRYKILLESTVSLCGDLQYFPVTITEPPPVVLETESIFHPSCHSTTPNYSPDGFVTLHGIGGTGLLSYSVDNGTTFKQTRSFGALAPGKYLTKAKDINGCESPPLTIMLNEPPALSIEATTVPASCANKNDGVVIASASGGTPGYRYRINADPYSEADVINSLYHGTYIASVIDANGCVQSQSVTVAAPPVPSLNITSFTPTTCGLANGSVDVQASGDTGPFQYQWTNQRNDVIAEFSLLTDADSGTYILKVTDQLECVHDTSLTFSPSYPPKIKNKNESPPSCAGRTDGSVHLKITQGTEPYTITWPDGFLGLDRTDVASGSYRILIQDKNDCRTEADVSIPEPIPVIIATKNSREPNCRPDQKGMIEVSASGGSGVFTYRWNTTVEGPLIDNCTAGTYTVTVTDSRNCTSTKDIALTNFALEIPDQATCQGRPVVVKSPLEHSINTWAGPNGFQSTDSAISINEGGIYWLSVTTSQGCMHADTFKLRYDNQQLNADFLMTSQAFVGDTIVAIDISWPMPTNLDWTFDPGAVVIDEGNDYSFVRYDEPGTYTVKLRAAIGACDGEKSQTITILKNPKDSNAPEEERLHEESIIRMFSVHPNPVQGMLHVTVSLREMRDVQLELYHLGLNRRMISTTIEKNTEYTPMLNLSTLPPGVYVLTLKAGPELKTIRIIKL